MGKEKVTDWKAVANYISDALDYFNGDDDASWFLKRLLLTAFGLALDKFEGRERPRY